MELVLNQFHHPFIETSFRLIPDATVVNSCVLKVTLKPLA